MVSHLYEDKSKMIWNMGDRQSSTDVHKDVYARCD
jgi:hypothetical protein